MERKIARVAIGMLDPNPDISGRGQRTLRDADIITDFFPAGLMREVEDLNRDFSRQHRSTPTREAPKPATASARSPLQGSECGRLKLGEIGSSVGISPRTGYTAHIISVKNTEGGFPNACHVVRATIAFTFRHTGERIEVEGKFAKTDGQSITTEPLRSASLKMSESIALVLLLRDTQNQQFRTFSRWPFDPSAETVLEFGDWDLEINVTGDSDRDRAIAKFLVRLEPALGSSWRPVT